MPREITERELRNHSGEIMRGLDRGEDFIVTRNGVPVGQLVSLRRRHFVPVDKALAAFRGGAKVHAASFRHDVDAWLDQDPGPPA